jgi:LAGLIDADG endonuclease
MKTTNLNNNINLVTQNNILSNSIDPNYVSGLTQADGSFFVKINVNKDSNGPKSLSFVPKFTITQDLDSLSCLEMIKFFFNCGSISINESRNVAEFYCGNFQDIKNKIIPHFLNYPVYFDKLHAFNILIAVTNLLTDVRNRTTRNIEDQELSNIYFDIINLAISMNKASLRSNERINTIYSKLNKTFDPQLINDLLNSNKYFTNLQIDNSSLTSQLNPAFIGG